MPETPSVPVARLRRAAGLVFPSGELPFATDGTTPVIAAGRG